MKLISVSDDIVRIREFKAQISRLLRRLANGSSPLIVTQNGRAAGVVLAPAEYDRLCYREQLLGSVCARAVDANAGRVMDTATLRERLGERRKAR